MVPDSIVRRYNVLPRGSLGPNTQQYFAKARWPVKLSVQYDQSERERAGSIDEHAGQEFNSVANTLVRFGLLTHFVYSGSESL